MEIQTFIEFIAKRMTEKRDYEEFEFNLGELSNLIKSQYKNLYYNDINEIMNCFQRNIYDNNIYENIIHHWYVIKNNTIYDKWFKINDDLELSDIKKIIKSKSFKDIKKGITTIISIIGRKYQFLKKNMRLIEKNKLLQVGDFVHKFMGKDAGLDFIYEVKEITDEFIFAYPLRQEIVKSEKKKYGDEYCDTHRMRLSPNTQMIKKLNINSPLIVDDDFKNKGYYNRVKKN